MSQRTTISLSKNNCEKLKQIGKYGETYDDIDDTISQVLKEFSK